MLVILIAMLSTTAFAVWDGQGDVGDGNASSVTGEYQLPYANENDILGYRFTVISGTTGYIKGYSIDIDRKAHGMGTIYRSQGTAKISHPELYAYYEGDERSVTVESLSATEGTESNFVFRDTSLPSTPTAVETWLSEDKAREIAVYYCGASDFDYATDYLIVEPILMAKLEGDYYAMTVAEYAVYQASLYGWTGLGDADAGTEGTYRYNIMRFTSGVWGRYLYAEHKYPYLRTTPVPWSALGNDANGTASVLLGSSTRYNTAANILKYQVGMAVYTGVAPTNTYTLTVDPNGGTWEGAVF